ncbi:MAG: hypothetical protein JWO65_709 [Sphingomonas bacterium]|jgi:hypothetical protein|nr:hypothetical protein [Sphingomonas bacterium]
MRQAYLFPLLASGMIGAAAMAPTPASAQVEDRVVIVYGDERCPSSNGQEIVVCKREPLTEKYRIPKDLRESEPDAHALGGQAVSAMASTGGTGVQINSCNAIGAGVSVGCVKKEADAWKADQKAQAKASYDGQGTILPH